MIRITRMNTSRDLDPPDFIEAIEAAQQGAEAVVKVPGIKWCKVLLSRGDLVFVTEHEKYGNADAALDEPAVQAAIGKLSVGFGFRPAGDEFLNEIEQVMPFLKR